MAHEGGGLHIVYSRLSSGGHQAVTKSQTQARLFIPAAGGSVYRDGEAAVNLSEASPSGPSTPIVFLFFKLGYNVTIPASHYETGVILLLTPVA